jgi:archaellum component FlaG (FlaF/FlaG flagellin family)
MKTLASTLILTLFCLSAFAAPLADSTDKSNKKAKTASANTNYFTEVTEEPIVIKAITPISQPAINTIKIVVVNTGGETISKKEITMSEFLNGNYAANKLPEGSNFLMFYEGTAFYIAN